MLTKLALCSVFVVATGLSSVANAQMEDKVGVQLDRMKLYIKDGAREGDLGLSNHLRVPVLVHTSFQDLAGNSIKLFDAYPPLYRLESGKTNRVRIRAVGDLPQDKESVFFVTVTAIPATEGSGNQLRYSLGQRIRMYYRPASLTKNCAWVADQLKWTLNGSTLIVENPTNISMPMLGIDFGNKKIDANLLLPGQVHRYTLPKGVSTAKFRYQYRSEADGIKTREVNLGEK